nr:MAG: hypothetical protein [Bacteriophage sp.]
MVKSFQNYFIKISTLLIVNKATNTAVPYDITQLMPKQTQTRYVPKVQISQHTASMITNAKIKDVNDVSLSSMKTSFPN